MNEVIRNLTAIVAVILASGAAGGLPASEPVGLAQGDLAAAFEGAQEVHLATSDVSSVVTLREVVGIPPPSTPVLVKTFKRENLPRVLQSTFLNPGIAGVTIQGKYIAIIQAPIQKEQDDTLRHELVHAYITLASPEELPFWFQEASAVHFSTDKAQKFYGQPSKTKPGMMEGRVVELTDTYKQKLKSFHFLIDQVGQEKFYKWYRQAVLTGNTDAGPLLGLEPKQERREAKPKKRFPLWLGGLIGAVVLVVAVAGYFAAKTNSDYA
ncbi:MAG: hypothetical protein A2Z18_04705 [Armatimonadetes bacterium RBG_16_58_9]|nr:MAG: hypothetical protein A2Z18_04705 [Armatimonadetes bacterium RBG_16_58_9]